MTDREILVALYKAVDSLYLAVTGKPLRVAVQTEQGEIIIQNFGATNDACISLGTALHAV